MVRQYRIDHFNGLEVLVCEVYRKHTLTQVEYDAFQSWKEAQPDCPDLDESDFRSVLAEQFELGKEMFFGLTDPIPIYDYMPSVVLRGVIVDNRIASLQCDYQASVLSVEVCDEVRRFYNVLDSRHWRDMVSKQVEMYGSLFAPDND